MNLVNNRTNELVRFMLKNNIICKNFWGDIKLSFKDSKLYSMRKDEIIKIIDIKTTSSERKKMDISMF